MLILAWAAVVAVGLPIAVLAIEVLAAVLPRRRKPYEGQRPPVAVLVPAHNERAGIVATVNAIQAQLQDGDRLLVIADNCSDETAELARGAGAEAVERANAELRGKGYALAFGVDTIRDDPRPIVVLFDADCEPEPGCIDALAAAASATGRPQQGCYLIRPVEGTGVKQQVSALAFLVKNWVRPRGLWQLGMPCLLTGTGIAMPWDVLKDAPLASGNIVEDMQLGLDLALAGDAPMFCEPARVLSDLAASEEAATTQRTRWEHGHMHTLRTQVPRLLLGGVTRLSPGLFGLAMELVVPPLSALVMMWVAAAGVTGVLALLHGPAVLPLLVVAGLGGALFLAILAAWARFGRVMVPLGTLLSVPMYVLWKIPIYLRFAKGPETQWVRTERQEGDKSGGSETASQTASKSEPKEDASA